MSLSPYAKVRAEDVARPGGPRMRSSTCFALIGLAVMTESWNAAAQAPAPVGSSPPASAATAPSTTPTALPTAPGVATAPSPTPVPPATAPAEASVPIATAPASNAPATAPTVTQSVLDKISADAFADTYGSINYNFPKPQGPLALSPSGIAVGGNDFRAFDTAEGFSINWIGVNATYAADPIGGTVSLRMGPSAVRYNAGPDDVNGLQFVKQAYATWKPVGKLTLDLGKWDQPYGSEVADSQLNIDYTRSLLFWYAQPLFFTGLRVDYAPSDAVDLKVFAANGWNNSIDNNRGKSFGAQIVLKPVDQIVFYVGDVVGPEQADFAVVVPGGTTTAVGSDVAGANSHLRNLADLVIDF